MSVVGNQLGNLHTISPSGLCVGRCGLSASGICIPKARDMGQALEDTAFPHMAGAWLSSILLGRSHAPSVRREDSAGVHFKRDTWVRRWL